ncbi:snoaL-like domain protein [Mycobacterium intracellulare 1956]|uniref:SnoaL-like domain protein n=1 Tax=Mycobacterium intracellulare 1956 TaxID=1299331 RepID=X8CLU6_MYCIT|nr:snoaL-like domain protein [Mycobacterium intracellulare]EUA57342.1 snoaL-like domain protein [Mycobacterium intracellulare 1956]
MSGITALDTDAIRAELHDTAILQLPFEPAVPDTDRDGFLQLLSMMFVMFKQFTITITIIYDLVDPNVLVARYHSDAVGRDKPVNYQNEYIGVFHFVDGKITLWLEYANPEASHAAIAKFADDAPAVTV